MSRPCGDAQGPDLDCRHATAARNPDIAHPEGRRHLPGPAGSTRSAAGAGPSAGAPCARGLALESGYRDPRGGTAGGAVRLTDGPGPLLVGEGIESTLAAFLLRRDATARAWAALSTSGLRGLRLPPRTATPPASVPRMRWPNGRTRWAGR